MIRICHIVSGDLWAGAEAMVYNLLKGLSANPEVRLEVLLLNEGALARKLRRAGIFSRVVDESQLGVGRLYTEAVRHLKSTRPAVIHAHRYKENFLAYLASRRISSPALVSTQHGLIEKYNGFSSVKQRILHRANMSLMARGFKQIVAVSQEMKQALDARNGFASGKIAVIHNGIALPAPPPTPPERQHLVVGSCGRLVPVKDFSFMVKVARCAAEQSRDIRFRIAGDGPEKQTLADMIRRHELTGIFEMLGHVEDMPAFYDSIDVFMNTSLHEGIPMSVLEAMSHGRPIIAPEVGGLPEIVTHGTEGFLIPQREPDKYASRCTALLQDRGLRLQMAKAARRRIETAFSMESMANRYFSLYKRLSRSTRKAGVLSGS